MAEAKYSLVYEDDSRIDFPSEEAAIWHLEHQGTLGLKHLDEFVEPHQPCPKCNGLGYVDAKPTKVATRKELVEKVGRQAAS